MSEPQIIQDDNVKNLELAYVHDASAESVRLVLDAGADTDDGRSGWKWVRLRNGDLILGVYPRGATYEAVELDAQYPGALAVEATAVAPNGIPQRPQPIPDAWMVIDYRVPETRERYFTRDRVGVPFTSKQPKYTYNDPGGYWIVVPRRSYRIPDGWKVIAYRRPELGEQYFSDMQRSLPYRKTSESGVTPGDKWIVVPA